MGVAPAGRLFTSPLGVNTNTSSENMSTFRVRTNSSASVSCWLSSSLRTHSKSPSLPSFLLAIPCLYFQWAAMPYSAVWCISQVRICTSKGMPSRPMTVVWRDWYILGLGVPI